MCDYWNTVIRCIAVSSWSALHLDGLIVRSIVFSCSSFFSMCTLMMRQQTSLAYLEEVRQHLARLPSIDPNTRTLILTGFPNVGKSSFINKVNESFFLSTHLMLVLGDACELWSSTVPFHYQISFYWSHGLQISPLAGTSSCSGLLNVASAVNFLGHRHSWNIRPSAWRPEYNWNASCYSSRAFKLLCFVFCWHFWTGLERLEFQLFSDCSSLDVFQCNYTIAQQISLFNSLRPLFANKPVVLVANKIDVVCFPSLCSVWWHDRSCHQLPFENLSIEGRHELDSVCASGEVSLIPMSNVSEEGILQVLLLFFCHGLCWRRLPG